MEVGLSFSIFGKKTFGTAVRGSAVHPEERHFAQCGEFGIRIVELLIMEGYIRPGDWKDLQNIRHFAEKHNVRINSVHGPSGSPVNGHWLADEDEGIRRKSVQERKLAIEGAQLLGASYCVVEFEAYPHWPYWPRNQKAEAVFPRALDRWRLSLDELLKSAANTGVKLAIENIDGLSGRQLEAIVSQLDPDLAGVCFDVSHACYNGGLREELELLAPYVIGAHLSDNDALSGPAYVDRHWRPFTGSVDWEWLIHRLLEKSRCKSLILEILDGNKPEISRELAETCRKIEHMTQVQIARSQRTENALHVFPGRRNH